MYHYTKSWQTSYIATKRGKRFISSYTCAPSLRENDDNFGRNFKLEKQWDLDILICNKTTKNDSKKEQHVDFVAVILIFIIKGLEFGLTAAELAMLTRVAADKAKSKVFILASFFFYSQEKLSVSFRSFTTFSFVQEFVCKHSVRQQMQVASGTDIEIIIKSQSV